MNKNSLKIIKRGKTMSSLKHEKEHDNSSYRKSLKRVKVKGKVTKYWGVDLMLILHQLFPT
jgi:hypothetical protein